MTDIKNGEKHEVHICEDCATKKQFKASGLKLQDILEVLAPKASFARLKCPACGISYLEFRHGGRFGCPTDYEAFQKEIVPLLEKLHHGQTQHVGRVPPQAGEAAGRDGEIVRLSLQLNRSVEREEYEKAAALRDRITRLKQGEKERT